MSSWLQSKIAGDAVFIDLSLLVFMSIALCQSWHLFCKCEGTKKWGFFRTLKTQLVAFWILMVMTNIPAFYHILVHFVFLWESYTRVISALLYQSALICFCIHLGSKNYLFLQHNDHLLKPVVYENQFLLRMITKCLHPSTSLVLSSLSILYITLELPNLTLTFLPQISELSRWITLWFMISLCHLHCWNSQNS